MDIRLIDMWLFFSEAYSDPDGLHLTHVKAAPGAIPYQAMSEPLRHGRVAWIGGTG